MASLFLPGKTVQVFQQHASASSTGNADMRIKKPPLKIRKNPNFKSGE